MSYPTCKHGVGDPNFGCAECQKDNDLTEAIQQRDEAQQQIADLQQALAWSEAMRAALVKSKDAIRNAKQMIWCEERGNTIEADNLDFQIKLWEKERDKALVATDQAGIGVRNE